MSDIVDGMGLVIWVVIFDLLCNSLSANDTS